MNSKSSTSGHVESIFTVNVFERAWRNRVQSLLDFPGALNSERALQAELCSVFAPFNPERVVLVEPTVTVPSSGRSRTVRPDLIVCRRISPTRGTGYHIDLVVELKIQHQGRSYPNWYKDYENLATIAIHPGSKVNINHFGIEGESPHFSEKTQLISAVIAKFDSHAISPKHTLRKSLANIPVFKKAWETTNLQKRFYLAALEWGREDHIYQSSFSKLLAAST